MFPDATGIGEEELVERARNGDHSAYEILYRLNRDRIYGLLWRMSGGHHALAEDLLQEHEPRPGAALRLGHVSAKAAAVLRRSPHPDLV